MRAAAAEVRDAAAGKKDDDFFSACILYKILYKIQAAG